ncbi:MAG: FAD-dependent urate hydroxylase HpxO [Cyanobacteria bacterium P01_C01_bin.118]
MESLKVIVVGAGMGGLTTALAMQQAGYEVEVYDRVSALRPAGAGISLWSNGVKVLNRLGLGHDIASIGGPMEQMAYYGGKTGELLTRFSLSPLVEQVGQAPYPVARTDLQQMLLSAFGADRVQLNKRCVAIEQTADSATAIFEDGHQATGDIVVGADGTHSVIRTQVLGQPTERRYVGYVNWNGLVPVSDDLAPANSWDIYVADGQRASVMPVGDNRFYFFLDVPLPKGADNNPDTYRQELLAHFAGWAQPVQTLIQRLDPDKTNRVEIHDIEPLKTLVKGRVALIGDAAHSTAPDLGQGGCQAMEDAWTLANYLFTTNISVADALRRYEENRLERVTQIVLKARKRAEMTHGKVLDKTQRWYTELAAEDGSKIMGAIADTILQGPMH